MALDRWITLPLQQLEAIASESWGALRGESGYTDVPPLEPSFGLVGEALLDRTFNIATQVLSGVPLPETVRKMAADVSETRDHYESRGWLSDPRRFHLDPGPVGTFELVPRKAYAGPRPTAYQHLQFESGYAPDDDEPMGNTLADHPANGTAHTYVLEHEEPRPWLVCVHGFSMGSPAANFNGFDVRLLHEELGLNLAFPVLPLHGPRSSARFSGSELLQPNFLQVVHVFAQAVWDVRRLIGWLRAERGAREVGLYGVSLGGYISALVAGLESQLACVIAGIPAVDFPNLARDNQPFLMRRYDDGVMLDWKEIRAITHVVSPLAFAPKVPRDRRFIYAGIADRVVRPDQARALWRHWERPSIHWFSGGHVLGIRNSSVGPFLAESLEGCDLTRPPATPKKTKKTKKRARAKGDSHGESPPRAARRKTAEARS